MYITRMTCPPDEREQQIIGSWMANAEPWTRAVRSASIASRRLVTDRAILDAVTAHRPLRVLDVGCGEGWLARALAARGIDVAGIDAVPALIAAATALGGARYWVQDYAQIAAGWFGGAECSDLSGCLFDSVVCNFSLFGKESVESLLGGLRRHLGRSGCLFVQTLHPTVACGDGAYRDGWRAGSWAGFDDEFRDPAPWYFRTLGSWITMLRRCGFEIVDCREPTVDGSSLPSSLILVGKLRQPEQT